MREIKFRAMHIEKQIMIQANCLYFNEFNTVEEQFNDEDYVFMQYTGLKDKNGVEIYEGDIVKAHSYKPTTFKIEFIEGGFCATRNGIEYPIDINHFYPSIGCTIEVIGNIYENKEFLGDNN